MTKKKKSYYNRRPMEGYININRAGGIDFNNLDIDGRRGGDAESAQLVHEITREIEDQKRLLDIKVKLEGGGYGYVFTLRHVDHITRFNCHLCEVVIIGQTNVDEHILGKKHQVKMATPYHNPSLFPRIFTPIPMPIPVPRPPPPPPVVVLPVVPPPPPPPPEVEVVQPVIPGFEEKLLLSRGVAQIQPTLDRHTSSPLVGLEYIVELTPRERDEEPMYVCTLCDKRGDPRVAMAHITSYNHRSKYLGINFPKASRAIALALPRSKEGRQGNVGIVSQICAKIEEKHGRLIPLTIDSGDYEEKKDFYRLKIEHDLHFRETAEETFTDVVETLTTTYSIKLEEVPLPAPVPEPEKREDPKRKIAADRSRIRPHASKCDDKKDEKVDEKKVDKKDDKKVDKKDDKKIDKKDYKRDEKKDDRRDDKKDDKKDYKKDIITKAMESKKPSVSGKPKRGKRSDSLSSISSVSSSTLSRSPSPSRSRSRSKSRSRSRSNSPFNPRDVYKRNPERRANRNSRRRRSVSRDRRSRSRSPSHRGRNRSRSRSNDSKSRYRNPPFKWAERKIAIRLDPIAVEKEKWTNFREELNKVEQRLTKSLKFHEKNPEKHPLYPDEWKKFWNKRYKEIQASGQDPAKHDFKPEWIEFWNVRMKEMHHGELQKAKEELRKALNLPKDNSVPAVRLFVKRPPPQPVEDDDIIVISPPHHSGRDIKPPSRKSRKRSPSPWDDEESYRPSGRQYSRSKASSYSERPRGYNRPPSKPHYEEDDPVGGASTEPIKVVTVLRLVTALESQLGSIGPTVNNLLASALAMEKARPGSSEVLLGNTDNLVLFDTVKEKLKGQLFAGIIEQGLLLATRSCIQNLAELLYRAENMPNAPSVQAKPAPLVAKPQPVLVPVPVPVPVPMVVPEVGAMNKVAIAEQIAAALIAQGKTDVTHEELEQLINAVVGMAQASANMDTPITTAAFASLQQRPAPPPSAPPPPTPVAPPPTVSPPTPTPPIMPDRSPLERLLSVVHSKTTPPAKPVVSAPLFPCVETNIPEAPRAPSISSSPPKKQKREQTPEVKKMSVSYMEDLNESDLKELLQNFSHLSTPEQHCLIAYLKKLEATDPDRVEKLRKFVNLSPIPEKDDDEERRHVPEKICKEPEKEKEETFWKGRLSPFSMRMGGGGNTPLGGANPSHDEPMRRNEDREVKKIKLDDSEDDDDYSYEDIYAAASKKVNESEKEKEQEKLKAEAEEVAKNYDFDIQPFNKLLDEKPSAPALLPKKGDPSAVLRETKLLIANLMGQLPLKFNQKNVSPPSKNINPSTPKNMILPTTPTPTLTITTPTKPIITTPTEDLPKRSKIGTNIDISNNLTDAAAASKSAAEVSGINVVSGVRPVPTLVSAPSPGQMALSYNPQYQQFHEEPQPHDQGPYQGGYPYQQGYPGPEYNGFYPGQPQEPQQEYRPPAARGYPPQQQGYPHPRPMQPPYGGAGPPQQHRYPNQYGGPGPGYNQFPQHPPQGYY